MNAPAAPVFNLNADDAEAADKGGRITETGAYVGTITKMKWRVYDSGSAAYQFDFESNQGQDTQGLTIFVVKKDGTNNDIGMRQVSALLCCLGVRTMSPQQQQIEEDVYDTSAGKYQKQTVTAFVYPEVYGKPVGLVLQKEHYSKSTDGTDAFRMNFDRSFHHESRKTAAEMIESTRATKAGKPVPEAVTVDSVLEYLQDKDSRNQIATSGAPANQYNPHDPKSMPPTPGGGGGGFDDDIPFSPVHWLA